MILITDIIDLTEEEDLHVLTDESGWVCSQCTYINSSRDSACEMCQLKKEKSKQQRQEKKPRKDLQEKKQRQDLSNLSNLKEPSDEMYMSAASRGRDYWFELVKSAPGSTIWPVLALPGTAADGARGSKPRVNLQVLASGAVSLTSRTATAPVAEAVQAARLHKRRYVWLPMQLSSSSAIHQSEKHANALFFDLEKKEVWVFEPHGGDVQNAGQGHFQNFYLRQSYESAMHTMLDPLGLQIHMPRSYMPPLFGQAVTGDRWCVLWTLLFFDGATRNGPVAFIEEWRNATVAKIQAALVHTTQWMIVHPSYLRA